MFRQSLLPRACLTLVLGLFLCGAPALGQDRSPYERLDRLERDLNMLQRHVYRGAPAPVLAADGAAAVNAQLRMDRLEAEMRELTGRFEEYANRIEQLRQRLDQVNSSADLRLSQAPAGPGPYATAPPPGRPAHPGAARGAAAPEPFDDEPGAARPGGPTPIYGTLTPPGSPRPTELASAAAAAAPPAGGALPSGSATEQYNHAFGLLRQANYPAAEAAFKAFVEAHPRDKMAGNAQYWLAETHYARGRYMEAATAFAEGYKRFPQSSKAPDGLLKLGMALARANQKQNACVALAQLSQDFPQAASSVRERAAAERKKLGC